MSSAVPGAVRAVYNALVARLPASTVVFVGPGVSDTHADFVAVGMDDPDETTYANAVTGNQQWAQIGGMQRDETFHVHCVAVSSNGDGDCLKAMDGVFALMAGIEAAVVADPGLGGALLWSPGITSFGLKFATDNRGATAHLPFDVECKTRI